MPAVTIAAISTPRGRGGIAVLRVSGDDAVTVAARVFMPAGGIPLTEAAPGRTLYGAFNCGGDIVDYGMAVVFRAPRSYTGEDTVELSCHGGIFIPDLILTSLIEAGASLAGPGEFTQRALLNGKMTLTGAEAVAQLLECVSAAGAREAAAQSQGTLHKKIADIAGRITRLLAGIYVTVDYPEEALSEISDEEIHLTVSDVLSEVGALCDSYGFGRAITEGIPAAIIGKSNTGKSTLFNLLARDELAIVTDIAGTTRDVIESRLSIGDIVLRIADTAGIRDTGDPVESIGIGRAVERARSAELILAVFDRSAPLDSDDFRIIELLKEVAHMGVKIIAVMNKSDIPADSASAPEFPPGTERVYISARDNTADGYADAHECLRERIAAMYRSGDYEAASGTVITGQRQYAALCGARSSLESAERALSAGFGRECAGADLELALSCLEECGTARVSERIIDEIFANFCVGK